MEATDEQQRVIEAVGKGVPRIKVRALAGVGKTEVARMCAEAIPNKRVLLMVFNKAAQLDAKARMPSNTDSRTAHSLAYRKTIDLYGKDRLTGSDMALVSEVVTSKHLYELRDLLDGDATGAALVAVKGLTRYIQSADPEPLDKHAPEVFLAKAGKKHRHVLTEAVKGLWSEMNKPGSTLPITHDTYLKRFALSEPKLPYDTLLIDEGQDLNPVIFSVIDPQNAQKVVSGDSFQSIYKWRNAVDAMERTGGVEFPLTGSFRFNQTIANEGNQVLNGVFRDELSLRGLGPEGEVVRGPVGRIPLGATVLCRGNAEIISTAAYHLDTGRKVAVVGGTDEAVRLLYASYDLFTGKRPNHPELTVFRSWSELSEFAGTEDGRTYKPVVQLVQTWGRGVPNLCRKLRYETVEEGSADLLLSTAHRAKGREFPTVVLGDDFPALVEPGATGKPRLRSEEANLLYVALTRARRLLYTNGTEERVREAKDALRSGAVADEHEEGDDDDRPEDDGGMPRLW